MFASIAATPATLSFAASRPNASTVGAETLHTTGVEYARYCGRISST